MSVSETVTAAPTMEKRRRRLLESALLVFSRRGFHETRIEDVCAEAAISRATFYRYFDSKDSLFDALVDLMSEEVIDIASHLAAVTPDEAGFATLSRWIGELLANTERWGSVVNEIIRPRDEHAAARNRAILLTTRFAEILGERFKEGGVADIDPQMAALAIIAMTERMATQMTLWNVEIDREVVIPSLATMALKMLHPTIKFAGA
ncbi:MAG: TetR/AcrR family transcriptional regulator [Frankiaceae bacterium]|nr:TetR/AcrR family transcriptional regulator [Frankiaceae bacterium]